MIARVLVAIALLAAREARADEELPHCDAHNPRPRDHPLGGKLRWDIAATGLRLADDWKLGAGLAAGVTLPVDKFYVFSLDVGLRGTFGSEVASTKLLEGIVEGEVRWYPGKLRQAIGIDECDCGTKTRRWSEGHDYAPYILTLSGYGHMRYVDVASRDAFLLTFGLGVDFNLAQKSSCPDQDPNAKLGGNWHSLFAQAGWRFDLAGSTSSATGSNVRIGGWFLEAGVRL
jgi:hypothetical protein